MIDFPHGEAYLFPDNRDDFHVDRLISFDDVKGVGNSFFPDIRDVHEAFLSIFESLELNEDAEILNFGDKPLVDLSFFDLLFSFATS